MNRKTFLMTAFTAGSIVTAALAVDPVATPATQPAETPATQPATRPVLPEAAAVPDDLTGTRLAIRAQQAFNRGEYVTALPLLKKLAAEAEGQPAKKASIQERIRVCEKAIEGAKAEVAKKNLTPGDAPKPVDVSPEARKPHAALAAGQVYEVSIQGLGNFEYDQDRGGNVPEDVQKLSGATIRVRGYMIPMDSAENITQFALVPSLFACCSGQPPTIQHTIVVNCPKGKAVGYTADEIVVEGGLNVQERKDDGYILSLFEMNVTSVKIAPKG